MLKETFVKKITNAEITAGNLQAFQFQEEANKNNNLPHNQLTITNLNTTCKLFIFLDDVSNQDIPDYTLFPNQQFTINNEEGVSYHTIFIKNTHAVNAMNADEIKIRISTVKEV